ncbi:hypothetical protein INR49_014978 [Caranx melampygus]|nr:hypothetical protein INR49_014978 [Caranx melampygus]
MGVPSSTRTGRVPPDEKRRRSYLRAAVVGSQPRAVRMLLRGGSARWSQERVQFSGPVSDRHGAHLLAAVFPSPSKPAQGFSSSLASRQLNGNPTTWVLFSSNTAAPY